MQQFDHRRIRHIAQQLVGQPEGRAVQRTGGRHTLPRHPRPAGILKQRLQASVQHFQYGGIARTGRSMHPGVMTMQARHTPFSPVQCCARTRIDHTQVF